VEIARRFLPAGLRPDPNFMPQVTAGPYLAAVDSLGSPADRPPQILAQPESIRLAVDELLRRGEGLKLSNRATPGAPTPVSVEKFDGASVTPDGGCALATGTASGSAMEVSQLRGLVSVTAAGATALVYLRRFADDPPDAPLGLVAPASPSNQGPDQTAWIALPTDGTNIPWHLEIFTRGAVTLCAFLP
jgi:hypothetical protein